MVTYHDVMVDVQEKIALITLNRPKSRNAFNGGILSGLYEAANHVQSDPSIDVAVITGAGDQSFCAGIDLKMFAAGESLSGDRRLHDSFEFIQLYRNCFTNFEKLAVPVIAAVNGFCLGAGLELALACDIRLADETASFSIPEVLLGIIPDGGGTQRLTKIVGVGKAKELIYTGRRIDAREALRIGLVQQVFSKDMLMEETRKMAKEISAHSAAVRGCKRAINVAMSYPLDVGLLYETSLQQPYLEAIQKGASELLAKVKDKK